MSLDRRAFHVEVRAKGRKLTGYAAVFDNETRIPGIGREVIRRGAFEASLASGRDHLALVDHDPSRVLARRSSNTLRLSEDSKGLAFDLDVPETSYGHDVLALAERGDLGGMSFGFSVPDGGENWTAGRLRELRAVELYEISVVASWPAYEGTEVYARGLRKPGPTPRLAIARRRLKILEPRLKTLPDRLQPLGRK